MNSSPLCEHIALNKPVPYRIRFKTTGRKYTVDPNAWRLGVRIEFV